MNDEQLTLAELGVNTDVALSQNNYTPVGRMEILVTEQVQLGFGTYDKLNEAKGRIYANLVDTDGNPIKGKVKFQIRDAQDNVKIEKISEHTLSAISLGATDQSKRTVYPFTDYIADRQRVITTLIKCTEAGKTLDVSESEALISARRIAL